MNEVTVKRVCKPGWKNCKMPELRQRIAELEAAYKHTVEDNEDLVRQLDAVKALIKDWKYTAIRFQDSIKYDGAWQDKSERLMKSADELEKALQQGNDDE